MSKKYTIKVEDPEKQKWLEDFLDDNGIEFESEQVETKQ